MVDIKDRASCGVVLFRGLWVEFFLVVILFCFAWFLCTVLRLEYEYGWFRL